MINSLAGAIGGTSGQRECAGKKKDGVASQMCRKQDGQYGEMSLQTT